MNVIIKALSALANMQRDKMLREEAHKQKKVRKGSGFSEVLEDEQKKLKGGEEDGLHARQ